MSAQNVEKEMFKINILYPGVSYELGVGDKSTLNFQATFILVAEGDFRNGIVYEIFPMLTGEFRYFVNMNRRIQREKNTSGNSANYISFLNQVIFAVPLLGNIEYNSPLVYLGAFTYDKGFYFSITSGPGFFTGDNDPQATLYLDVRSGWVFNKKNK